MAKKIICKRCGDCCHTQFELFLLNLPDMQQTRTLIRDAVEKGFKLKFKSVEDISVTVYGECKYYDKKDKKCLSYKKRPERCQLYYCGRYTE